MKYSNLNGGAMRYLLVAIILFIAGCCNDIHCQLSNYLKPMEYSYLNPPNNIDAPGSLFNANHRRKASASELGISRAVIDGQAALPNYIGNDSSMFSIGGLGIIPQLPSPASVSLELTRTQASKVSIKLTKPKVKVLTELGFKKAFTSFVEKNDVRLLSTIFPDNKVLYISEVLEVGGAECSFYGESGLSIAAAANATMGTVSLAPGVKASYKGDNQFQLTFDTPLFIGYKMEESTLPVVRENRLAYSPPAPQRYQPSLTELQSYHDAEAKLLADRVKTLARQNNVNNVEIPLGTDARVVVKGGRVTVTPEGVDKESGAVVQPPTKTLQTFANKVRKLHEAERYAAAKSDLDSALTQQKATALAAAMPTTAPDPKVSFSKDMSEAWVRKGDRIITVRFTGEKGRPE
jgi:hypothetical protein